MTRITDEKTVFCCATVRIEGPAEAGIGNGWFFSYKYNWPNNQYYPDKVVVTLPDQTKRVVRVAATVPEYIKNFHR